MMDPMTGKIGVAEVKAARMIRLQLAARPVLFIRLSIPRFQGEDVAVRGPTSRARPKCGRVESRICCRRPGRIPRRETTARSSSLRGLDSAAPEGGQFTGTAAYTIEFERPSADAERFVLDLATFCEHARVILNGADESPH